MGKGSKQRPTNKKKFDPNYDNIKWRSNDRGNNSDRSSGDRHRGNICFPDRVDSNTNNSKL